MCGIRLTALQYTERLGAMSSKRKRGYNWKARQQKVLFNIGVERAVPEIEGLSDADALYYAGVGGSNALVLPSKRKKIRTDDVEPAPKGKKLSTRQKKRLQKIVEAKERKAQVCFRLMRTTRVTTIINGRGVVGVLTSFDKFQW